jgi:predicted HicB family RNase H-like nuclease
MKNNILEYKRYIAQLDFDLEDGIIIGKVTNTKDIISFHASNLPDIKQAFKDIIDTYLKACEEEGIKPSKSYSGKFNLRINPDLHRELSIEAAQEGVSLNDLTEQLLKSSLSNKHNLDDNHKTYNRSS